MKKIFLAGTTILLLILSSQSSFAQNKKLKTDAAAWVPENGFWVIENNIQTPRTGTIYFYNNDKQLVYKQHYENTKLNLNRKKIKMNLKKTLDQALLAFEQNNRLIENELLVKQQAAKN